MTRIDDRTEKASREKLNQAIWKLTTDTAASEKLVIGSKSNLLFPASESKPSGLNLASPGLIAAGGIAGLGLATGPLSRRHFFRRAAVAGGVVGGLLWASNQKAEAGFWGFCAASALAGLIGWVVGKVCDWAWYSLTEKDLTATKAPAPSKNQFHNSYAPCYEVTNTKKHFTVKVHGKYDTPIGLDEYLLDHELNYPEAFQVKLEFEVYNSVLLPKSDRFPVKEDLKPAARTIARRYGLKDGDYTPEYINLLTDKNGKDHVGLGATVGTKEKYLLA